VTADSAGSAGCGSGATWTGSGSLVVCFTRSGYTAFTLPESQPFKEKIMIKAVLTRDGGDIRARKLSEFNHTELKFGGENIAGRTAPVRGVLH